MPFVSMSPSTSTIQDFTDALIANLRDETKHPTLRTVAIVDGPPNVEVNQLGEWIMFGNVEGSQNWATLNAVTKPKDEIYTLEMWIDVVMASDYDQTTVSRRMITLLAEVENELRSDPAQGVEHVLWSGIESPLRVTKNAQDLWRETWLVCGIKVRARI